MYTYIYWKLACRKPAVKLFDCIIDCASYPYVAAALCMQAFVNDVTKAPGQAVDAAAISLAKPVAAVEPAKHATLRTARATEVE